MGAAGVTPAARSSAMKSGAVSALSDAAFKIVTNSVGVPRLTAIRLQSSASKPGRPIASATVGTSGARGERWSEATASIFTRPS